MSDWFRIASAAECPAGTSPERVVAGRMVAGRMVAVANVAGAWHAIDAPGPPEKAGA